MVHEVPHWDPAGSTGVPGPWRCTPMGGTAWHPKEQERLCQALLHHPTALLGDQKRLRPSLGECTAAFAPQEGAECVGAQRPAPTRGRTGGDAAGWHAGGWRGCRARREAKWRCRLSRAHRERCPRSAWLPPYCVPHPSTGLGTELALPASPRVYGWSQRWTETGGCWAGGCWVASPAGEGALAAHRGCGRHHWHQLLAEERKAAPLPVLKRRAGQESCNRSPPRGAAVGLPGRRISPFQTRRRADVRRAAQGLPWHLAHTGTGPRSALRTSATVLGVSPGQQRGSRFGACCGVSPSRDGLRAELQALLLPCSPRTPHRAAQPSLDKGTLTTPVPSCKEPPCPALSASQPADPAEQEGA